MLLHYFVMYLLITVHIAGCCCFADIDSSQASIATHLRGGGIFHYRFNYKFTAKSAGERILKIGQYVAKLGGKIQWHFLSGHSA